MMDDQQPSAEEVESLLVAMANRPNPGQYTAIDKYRDFRAVFGTEQGRRVLYEILAWGHMFRPSILGAPIDPYLTHVHEGERNIALRLLNTISKEPVTPPTEANRKRGDT